EVGPPVVDALAVLPADPPGEIRDGLGDDDRASEDRERALRRPAGGGRVRSQDDLLGADDARRAPKLLLLDSEYRRPLVARDSRSGPRAPQRRDEPRGVDGGAVAITNSAARRRQAKGKLVRADERRLLGYTRLRGDGDGTFNLLVVRTRRR